MLQNNTKKLLDAKYGMLCQDGPVYCHKTDAELNQIVSAEWRSYFVRLMNSAS